MEKKTKSKTKKESKKLAAPLYNQKGEKIGQVDLAPEIFGEKISEELMTQAVRVYTVNQRSGNASTKTRSEVAGGGAKPWRQKGLGRARAGSTRAPHWRGGGVIHGPKKRVFELSLPKKMKKKSLLSAFSSKAKTENILVLDQLSFKEPKTKVAASLLSKLPVKGKNLFITEDKDQNTQKSLRNLSAVDVRDIKNLNTYLILSNDYLIFTKEALSKAEDFYVKGKTNGSN